MTEGDIIKPIKDCKAISDTRRRLQTLHSVRSCSAVPIQGSQSGGNDIKIKHEEQNTRNTGLEKKQKKGRREEGGDLIHVPGSTCAQNQGQVRPSVWVREQGSPKNHNAQKTSVLLRGPPCHCGDGQCRAPEKASLKGCHRGAKKHRVRACHLGKQLIQKSFKKILFQKTDR